RRYGLGPCTELCQALRPKRGLGRGLALNVSMGGARGLGHCLAARRDFKSSHAPSPAVRLAVAVQSVASATDWAEGLGPVPCSKQWVSERALRRASRCVAQRVASQRVVQRALGPVPEAGRAEGVKNRALC